MFRAEGGEEFFQLFQIVVRVDAECGFGDAGGIDEAGVGEFIEDDEVVFPDDDG